MMEVKRKGFFLAFSLGILIILSLFCLGLGFRVFVQTRKTKLFLNKTRAFYLAVSGIKIAGKIIEEDKKAATVDHLQEDWVKPIHETIEFPSSNKEGRLEITIEDESARININKIDFDKLPNFLNNREVENSEEKAKYIIEYRKKALSVEEELLLIEVISCSDYDKVKGFITVFGNGKININTASLEILNFFIEDTFLKKKEILIKRFGVDLVEGDDTDGYYDDTSWQEVMKEKISGDTSVLLEDIFVINSSYFRIASEAEVEGVKKKITCVMRKDSGKILYWYEK